MSYHEERMKRKMGLLPPLPTKKPKKPIPKISAKKKVEQKISGDSEMDIWFDTMRKKCKGRCFFCQGGTMYEDEDLWKWRSAIAHLFPKEKFKSIATHEENWIELCLSCHRSFDDGNISWVTLKDSAEWSVLSEKLLTLLPLTHPDERKTKFYHNLEQLIYNK